MELEMSMLFTDEVLAYEWQCTSCDVAEYIPNANVSAVCWNCGTTDLHIVQRLIKRSFWSGKSYVFYQAHDGNVTTSKARGVYL